MDRILTLADIDDYLGPGDSRFFGSGYRRAEYQLGPVRNEDDALRSNVAISYPSNWSTKKAGTDLRPHLSTVDTMILGAEFTERLLATVLGLSSDQRAAATVRKIVIQAGTQPEESLDCVQVEAQIAKSSQSDNGSTETTTRVQIGQMRTRLVVSHEANAGSPAPQGESADIGRALAPAQSRYWGSGFRFGRQTISPVHADIGKLTASGGLSIAPLPESIASGLGGRPEGPTPVDAFVTVLQLAQVLLYEMDNIPRADSNTLWMQQAILEVDDNAAPENREARVEITDSRLIELPDGRWRNVNFTGSAGRFGLRCVFAHRLPAIDEAFAS